MPRPVSSQAPIREVPGGATGLTRALVGAQSTAEAEFSPKEPAPDGNNGGRRAVVAAAARRETDRQNRKQRPGRGGASSDAAWMAGALGVPARCEPDNAYLRAAAVCSFSKLKFKGASLQDPALVSMRHAAGSLCPSRGHTPGFTPSLGVLGGPSAAGTFDRAGRARHVPASHRHLGRADTGGHRLLLRNGRMRER